MSLCARCGGELRMQLMGVYVCDRCRGNFGETLTPQQEQAIRDFMKPPKACENYSRPQGIMGGPCLNCGRSQPEHVKLENFKDG